MKELTKFDLGKAVELGKLLGQRKAFGLIAGRCSAAHAASLKEIRDGKKYEATSPSWDEFCETDLHISRSQANRIIKNLEDFGPAYFELTQLTAVSPREYRELAPAIADHRLEINGQSIALIPEKAEEVAAAVDELRRKMAADRAAADKAAVKPATSARERLELLDRDCRKLAAEFENLSLYVGGSERDEFTSVLVNTIGRLRRIDSRM